MNDLRTRVDADLHTPTAPTKREVRPLFEVGRIFIDRRVLDRFPLATIDEALADHVECQTGPCSDWQLVDDVCLRDGGPMFFIFRDELGNAFHILTEPDRSKTTVTMIDER